MGILFSGLLWLLLAIFIEFKIGLIIFIIYSIFFFTYCYIIIKNEFSSGDSFHTTNNNNNDETFNNIIKTEMMSDMYKDITEKELDSVEKSLLFMHNSKKK